MKPDQQFDLGPYYLQYRHLRTCRLKHSIGADEYLTKAKNETHDPTIYYHFLHCFLHILPIPSLCFFLNIPSYNFFYTFTSAC